MLMGMDNIQHPPDSHPPNQLPIPIPLQQNEPPYHAIPPYPHVYGIPPPGSEPRSLYNGHMQFQHHTPFQTPGPPILVQTPPLHIHTSPQSHDQNPPEQPKEKGALRRSQGGRGSATKRTWSKGVGSKSGVNCWGQGTSDDEIGRLEDDELADCILQIESDVKEPAGLSDEQKQIAVSYLTSDGQYEQWRLKAKVFYAHVCLF